MDNNIKAIGVLGALAAAYLIHGEVNKGKLLTYKLLSAKPDFKGMLSYGFSKLPIEVKIRLSNPSSIEMDILTINIKVFLNDILLGEIIQPDKFKIAANKETTVNINTLLNIESLGLNYNDFSNILKSKKLDIKLTGFIDTSVGRYQMNQLFNLGSI